jgi:hypothetical protein
LNLFWQAAGFLQTGGIDAPWPLIELRMCQMYGCTPKQLRKQDLETVLSHVVVLNAEAHVKKTKAKENKRRKK